MSTALVYHPDYLEHDTGHHPENRLRLAATMEHLGSTGLLARLVLPEPREADRRLLELAHSRKQVDYIAGAALSGISHLDADTPISADSYRIALLAAGGVLEAIDWVMAGRAANALALVRPPGHHAGRNKAMGFCLFNNVAVGARHLTLDHGLARVAIVDIDAHHGNGTQEIFYDDPAVLYISLHQYPHYPGTGAAAETGAAAAAGTTVNLPLPAGSGDDDYLEAWRTIGQGSLERFEAEFVLISLGFDAHQSDPLSDTRFTSAGYRALTESIIDTAADCCGGRLVSVLEGGYNLKTLPGLVAEHLELLLAASEARSNNRG